MPFTDKAGFTNAKFADKRQIDELVVEGKNSLYIFNRVT